MIVFKPEQRRYIVISVTQARIGGKAIGWDKKTREWERTTLIHLLAPNSYNIIHCLLSLHTFMRWTANEMAINIMPKKRRTTTHLIIPKKIWRERKKIELKIWSSSWRRIAMNERIFVCFYANIQLVCVCDVLAHMYDDLYHAKKVAMTARAHFFFASKSKNDKYITIHTIKQSEKLCIVCRARARSLSSHSDGKMKITREKERARVLVATLYMHSVYVCVMIIYSFAMQNANFPISSFHLNSRLFFLSFVDRCSWMAINVATSIAVCVWW